MDGHLPTVKGEASTAVQLSTVDVLTPGAVSASLIHRLALLVGMEGRGSCEQTMSQADRIPLCHIVEAGSWTEERRMLHASAETRSGLQPGPGSCLTSRQQTKHYESQETQITTVASSRPIWDFLPISIIPMC